MASSSLMKTHEAQGGGGRGGKKREDNLKQKKEKNWPAGRCDLLTPSVVLRLWFSRLGAEGGGGGGEKKPTVT